MLLSLSLINLWPTAGYDSSFTLFPCAHNPHTHSHARPTHYMDYCVCCVFTYPHVCSINSSCLTVWVHGTTADAAVHAAAAPLLPVPPLHTHYNFVNGCCSRAHVSVGNSTQTTRQVMLFIKKLSRNLHHKLTLFWLSPASVAHRFSHSHCETQRERERERERERALENYCPSPPVLLPLTSISIA